MSQPSDIQVKASDEMLKGSYANIMNVSHAKEEFVLDFISVCPPVGQLVARIITSPGHMKRIIQALQVNLAQYESMFGSIEPAEEPKKAIGFQDA